MLQPAEFKLIVGLGNPGEEYRNTYHNAGFLAVEHLFPGAAWRTAAGWEYAEIGEKIVVRPLNFMNRSGEAVKNTLRRFRIPPENLLVIHDDSDLLLGKAKFVFGGGSAGHKGVASIQKELNTKEFWRLRLGIRPIGLISPIGPIGPIARTGRRAKAGDFVLKKMTPADLEKIYLVLDGVKLKVIENRTPS